MVWKRGVRLVSGIAQVKEEHGVPARLPPRETDGGMIVMEALQWDGQGE